MAEQQWTEEYQNILALPHSDWLVEVDEQGAEINRALLYGTVVILG